MLAIGHRSQQWFDQQMSCLYIHHQKQNCFLAFHRESYRFGTIFVYQQDIYFKHFIKNVSTW